MSSSTGTAATRQRATTTPGSGAPPPRAVIEHLAPEVDGGRFAAKRTVGQVTTVEADVFADGHEVLRVLLRSRPADTETWSSVTMEPLGNDRYRAVIAPEAIGRHEFEIRAAIDEYRSWLAAFTARRDAGSELGSDRAAGAAILREAATRARGRARTELTAAAAAVAAGEVDASPELQAFGALVDDTVPQASWASSGRRVIVVDRERAERSSWYELFPRAAGVGGQPGTLADVERRLGYIAELGFDVLYLPPIHPIGSTNRKGARGAPGSAGDPGSPWAIGSSAGGHTAVNPDLGTIDDFDHLVAAARAQGIEIALDYALQCSPDHPWVTEHPEWFRHRPDGTIACAENPPKRYEDVYPLDFASAQWRSLWDACKAIVDFWIDHGVTIFRVDNPHTKPFRFWEWLIAEVHVGHPDVIFLAEAFTRPRVMEHLAKLGFTQSYTYFTWRRTSWELREYLSELTRSDVSQYFRPNLWPNTPDILVAPLAGGSRPAFAIRAVLAATLSPSWGIYGPAFETCESVARHDAEEYLESDKYEIRTYAFDPSAGIAPLVARLNTIRRAEPAFGTNTTLEFHHSDNPELLAFSKRPMVRDDGATAVLVVVNLDPHYPQSGWVTIDPTALGLPQASILELADQLSGERFRWPPGQNFVLLDPATAPGHVFTVRSVS